MIIMNTFSANAASEKPGRVNRQIALPFTKSVEIAFQSIRVRFFRSLITTLPLPVPASRPPEEKASI